MRRFCTLNEQNVVNSKTDITNWVWDLQEKHISLFLWTELLTEADKKKPLFQFVFQCVLLILNEHRVIGALGFPSADYVFSESSSFWASSLALRTRIQKERKGSTMGSLFPFNCAPQKGCRLFWIITSCHWNTTEMSLRNWGVNVEVWLSL